jgi:nucleoside-diphosphate-sugar epimerase
MKVLVTGANGFVGTHLCRHLRRDGHDVVAAVRGPQSAPDQTQEFAFGDLLGPVDWKSALEGVDAVVHLAARVHVMKDTSSDPDAEFRKINVDGTMRLAKAAAAAGVQRFVYMSSIKVNGERTLATPFRASSASNPSDPYGVSKWEAELALAELAASSGMAVVSVRTPLVYGPGVRGNMARLIRMASAGYPVPLGSIRNKRTMISVWNLADLLASCSTKDELGSGLVLAGDSHSPSTPELYRELAAAVGTRPRILNIPVWLMSALGRLTGKSDEVSRLCDSLEVSTSSNIAGFDWEAPLSFEDGVRRFGSQWSKDAR